MAWGASRVAIGLVAFGLVACSGDGGGRDGGADGNSVGGSGGGGAGASGGAAAAGAAGTNAGTAGGGGRGGAGAGGTSAGAAGTGTGGRGGVAGGGAGRGGAGGVPGCADADYSAAPVLPLAHTDAAAPTPMGGTIASGTYYLTDFMYYGGTAIAGGICNSTFQYRLDVAASSDTTGTLRETLNFPGCCSFPTTWTYQTSGTTVAGPSTCGTPTSHSETYTATPTQIFWFRVATTDCWSNTTILFTFTKQ